MAAGARIAVVVETAADAAGVEVVEAGVVADAVDEMVDAAGTVADMEEEAGTSRLSAILI